ncbi:hypothetical protein [Mycobacterium sp.]|uniref:hypothetical protein n=1 Tax=Mycobacterium sp. TaxID=1785 RepID=UPI002BD0A697|nr:hypothetical protein [Mycobacterium sp.]HME48063.1 hypothetical protein [Mycobacterium sp.]
MPQLPKVSAGTPDVRKDPSAQAERAAAPVDTPSAEVLITEQEVRLATAAAVPSHRETTRDRLVAFLRRVAGTSADGSPPRPGCLHREPYYFEHARMAREMDNL